MATGLKTGGRTKGTPNTATKELREKFTLLLENNFDKLQEDIDLLEPKERVKTLLELSKFVIPTLRSTELKTDNETNSFQPVVINFRSLTPPTTDKPIEISFKD